MSNLFISGVSAVAPTFTAIGTLTASQNMTASTNAAGTVVSFAAPLQGEKMLAYSTAIVLTASGDILLQMNANLTGGYIVRRTTMATPTATTALVSPVARVATASNGGGTAIVTAVTVSGMTATTAWLDQTIATASTVLTAAQLFFTITTATSTVNSYSIYVFGEALGG